MIGDRNSQIIVEKYVYILPRKWVHECMFKKSTDFSQNTTVIRI